MAVKKRHRRHHVRSRRRRQQHETGTASTIAPKPKERDAWLRDWPTDANGDLSTPIPPWFLGGWSPTEEQQRGFRVLEAKLDVESFRRRYLDGRNPVYAWRAYSVCRALALPIPEWILIYLDGPAREFWGWSMAGRKVPGELGAALVEALGMGSRTPGPGTVFAIFDHRRWGLAFAVYRRVRPPGGIKLEAAIAEVCEKHSVSRATVMRAWGEHRADLLAGIGIEPASMSEEQRTLVTRIVSQAIGGVS